MTHITPVPRTDISYLRMLDDRELVEWANYQSDDIARLLAERLMQAERTQARQYRDEISDLEEALSEAEDRADETQRDLDEAEKRIEELEEELAELEAGEDI